MMNTYDSAQNFGYDLFRQCIQNINPVLSPVSVYLTLVMAGCGADEATRAEFVKVLGEDMMTLSADLMNTFTAKGDCLNLSIANSAWIDQRFSIDSTWAGTIKSLMGADTFLADLSSWQTMEKINRWIAAQTNNLIDQLLTEPLGPKGLLRLALFNTVYFKGRWVSPFDPFNTCKDAFYLHDGQSDSRSGQYLHRTVQTDMMRDRTANIVYLSNDFSEGVFLPYWTNQTNRESHAVFLNPNNEHRNKGIGLIALKPKQNISIRDVCSRLNSCTVHEMLSNSQPELADIKLPRFKSSFDIDLIESLTKIGLTKCFDQNQANLSLMGKDAETGDTLYVSLIRQKAVLTVDEIGTEAAASTELYGCLRGMADPLKKLYFNEPFLYMIMDTEKELPLFLGILDNPDL